jgi:creatinine amidohydrolase/Fe(II)-dependent formamide hydrolase-like protein
VRRKTLHRFMNDLVGSWEDGGVRGFVILTAHGYEPHQEALSTLRTRGATIRTVDIFSARLEDDAADLPIHGGMVDTSLLLYIDRALVDLQAAADFPLSRKGLRRWRRSGAPMVPPEGPGSLGRPTQASIEMGERLYHLIYQRIATRIFGNAQ